MNLAAVMDEVGSKLEKVPGLRVRAYNADSVAPPAAIVLLPEEITYDETYARGSDSMTLIVDVLVGKASDRASRTTLAEYADGSGVKSIKRTVDNSDSNRYRSCDTVTVRKCEFPVASMGGIEYLMASFHVDITGPGA
ncbi:hypothetical protein [Actinocrispum wychmicini]|uniref:Tail terminator n=1 Tax=Actinocrispum wychmicini TaxID=1213861 RepID=A0A4V2S8S3_9PSEU|nr:hypothetical protein [Actinocrispum wychmicini]TCO64950.1 hypothetical protein EV192_101734 [Actinocrispum wychmicini]